MKKVSVIIPCYNASKWLPKCFISCTEQTLGIENLELIFVDDASTDGGQTWELLLLMEQAYPDSVIVLQLEENRRQGGARNAALSYASGEYIAFVDADDWMKPECLETAYKAAKEKDADIIQFNHCLYSDKTGVFDAPQDMEKAFYAIESVEERKRFLISEKITYGCWNKLYKRQLIVQSGVQFAEHVVYEEPLFVYPLLYYGKRFAVIPDRLYIYRQNDSGTMHQHMKRTDTLQDHASVQYQVWKKMRETEFFVEFYEEIKMYFLHTFFYETLYFARMRKLEIPMEQYRYLEETALKEVPDLDCSGYEKLIPCQMKLYRLAKQGMTEEALREYMQKMTV